MLEIFALIALCNGNKNRALARGKSGGLAIAYTLVLWIGFEIAGIAIGISEGMDWEMYIMALFMAAFGGLVSFLLSLIGKKTAPADAQAPPSFITPCTVRLIRDPSVSDTTAPYSIILNGQNAGSVRSNEYLDLQTNYEYNNIRVTGGGVNSSYNFTAAQGTFLEIHYKDNQFINSADSGQTDTEELSPDSGQAETAPVSP